MTMTFVSLVLIEFFKAYTFRSDRHSVLQRPFANRWLNLAIAWELMLLVVIVYVPFLQRPFGTFALPFDDWLIIVGAALTMCQCWSRRRRTCDAEGSARRLTSWRRPGHNEHEPRRRSRRRRPGRTDGDPGGAGSLSPGWRSTSCG